MASNYLSEEELYIIYQCVKAAAYGPFISDWEFHPLFGFMKKEVQKVVVNWNQINDNDPEKQKIINNSLNTLIGYPHEHKEILEWSNFIPVSREELKIIYKKWRKKTNRD